MTAARKRAVAPAQTSVVGAPVPDVQNAARGRAAEATHARDVATPNAEAAHAPVATAPDGERVVRARAAEATHVPKVGALWRTRGQKRRRAEKCTPVNAPGTVA
mmetsp:Transcript_55839/g.126903  ORF Transcript_55839/g.126903 Transcript_55839/m.126903 type:complete len:104 (-) Transcript_55839:43-354(-)